MSDKPPKIATVKAYTDDDVRTFLRQEIKRIGSQAAFCRFWALSQSYVSEVLDGSRDPGPKILTVFKLALRKCYVPAEDK
jgi:hypothetical protein